MRVTSFPALIAFACASLLPLRVHAQEPSTPPLLGDGAHAGGGFSIETGVLGVIENEIQFGRPGTRFNLVTVGNEDIVFRTDRYSVFGEIGRQRIKILYQPFDLRTTGVAPTDLLIDGKTFPAGTVIDYRYGFSFWRAGYTYDLDGSANVLAIGGGIQIRNAAIEFRSGDGTIFDSNRDVGLVPLLSVRVRRWLAPTVFAELEADGIYAGTRYVNGGESSVEGSLLDANLRAGIAPLPPIELGATFRYLGGGAVGSGSNGRFSANRLQTGAATLFATLRF